MNVVGSIQRRLRANRAWVRMRRIQREGPIAALKRWRLWTRVLDSSPVITATAHEHANAEIHMLCCERDYLCALWALKSFYHFSRATYPLILHLQGWCPKRVISTLNWHFPCARIITQTEADIFVDAELQGRGLNRICSLRKRSPFMMKLADFVLTCRAERMLILDTDVLFFAYPRELIDAAQWASETALFQFDHDDGYNITAKEALELFGIRLAPRVNTGIAVIPQGMINLERCEEFLTNAKVARTNGLIEQTLYALCVSERVTVQYLSPDYLISLASSADVGHLVARHYTWSSRPQFTSEGIPALIRAGFLEAKENVP